MPSAISCPLWSSVYAYHKCDVLYAVLYVCVCCFVVCGCAVSRRYIDVCYCDMFSVINVYLDHLKFCVVCINTQMSHILNIIPIGTIKIHFFIIIITPIERSLRGHKFLYY